MGFPSDNTTDTLSGLGSIVIPQDLVSNVSKLHEFLFGAADYTPSSTVQTVNANIISTVNSAGTASASGSEEEYYEEDSGYYSGEDYYEESYYNNGGNYDSEGYVEESYNEPEETPGTADPGGGNQMTGNGTGTESGTGSGVESGSGGTGTGGSGGTETGTDSSAGTDGTIDNGTETAD